MEIPEHRMWMYYRLNPGRRGCTTEFLQGVEEFITFAIGNGPSSGNGQIRCPCSKHKNRAYLNIDEVKVDLYKRGFQPGYWYWTCHGEIAPSTSNIYTESSRFEQINEDYNSNYERMIFDVAGPDFNAESFDEVDYDNDISHVEQSPNIEAQKFYDLLNAYQQPLWPGCDYQSELSVAVEMLSIKADSNMSQYSFNRFASLMKRSCPPNNVIPDNWYQTKKLVSKLGLAAQKIDVCINGCMLYYKNDIDETICKFCGAARYKTSRPGRRKNCKEIPRKRMYYLPITPRLQRLYASMSSAELMQWHWNNRRREGIMCHPSDGEAWKHFDRVYPDFGREPRNVRLGLCTDGFNPFSHSASPYSCWPVIITPYNLPPESCMTMPYLFLTAIIPGPQNPKTKIDVFLQPLIDELKLLWEEGVSTFDVSTKQNFQMRAALMWTINDFPAYGMLSGWSTAGKLACPYCMDNSKAFTLKYGGKNSWFDSHRQFLPMNHIFRRNKDAFKKNRVENDPPPLRLDGEQLWQHVRTLPKIVDQGIFRLPGYGEYHNWTKQSIFWELPYWKDHLIRHNLDVMHIEKNIFDNIFNTVMDIKGKTKDNIKARMDLKEYCRRRDLELHELANGKVVKPKAKFTLTLDQRRTLCNWIKELKMPDGYCSNLSRCVNLREGKLFGLKSHDCHIFMERLLPIAFSALPEQIWKCITELSLFFRELCSATLKKDDLMQMEHNIPIILCKLERIFPPGFFDSMEHLPIHLPFEARVGGPVQYRWMYPFERFLNKLKRMVKNKARVEGSICEAYLSQELSYFCSYYFESHVPSIRTRVGRNDWADEAGSSQPTLSIFNKVGCSIGKVSPRYLSDREFHAAHLHILLNCDEVKPYIVTFEQDLRRLNPNISFKEIDSMIERDFISWFKYTVLNQDGFHDNIFLKDLAWGPLRLVQTWPGYFVNGYKFHTESWSVGKKTINSGVCVKGTGDGGENDYFGSLKEIVEVQYPGEFEKKVVLFYCDWFDPTMNRGMKIQKEYGIIEIKHTRRYGKFDPFVFAEQAIQVYYVPHPIRNRDNIDWWVVTKTKPRSLVDESNNLEIAYQEEESHVSIVNNEILNGSLQDGREMEEIDLHVHLQFEDVDVEEDENEYVSDDTDEDEEEGGRTVNDDTDEDERGRYIEQDEEDEEE